MAHRFGDYRLSIGTGDADRYAGTPLMGLIFGLRVVTGCVDGKATTTCRAAMATTSWPAAWVPTTLSAAKGRRHGP